MVDDFAGPRKLRYFQYLLVFVVFGVVISTILAELYGITFFEAIFLWLVGNPMMLLELAGILSIVMLATKALKMADNSGF